MQKLNFLLLFFWVSVVSELHSGNPQLNISTAIVSMDTVPKEIFGGFIELLEHYVNGPRGHWSQEIKNRGFDYQDSIYSGTANFWEKRWFSSENDWTILDTLRYNQNGIYSQKIFKNSDTGEIGITQEVYLNDSIWHDFYIYFLGNIGNDSLRLSLFDNAKEKIVFSAIIGVPGSNWMKKEIKIPPIKNSHKVDIIMSFVNQGYVNLDEISLMPENNYKGIRREYVDFYNLWKPGLFRYPGGCFADSRQNKLEYSIGDIDQRQSPNLSSDGIEQRMDFGLNEFIELCNLVGAEPHITINYENGDEFEAKNYVEYCNGISQSYWSNRRIQSGYSLPFMIKYWEIGNEQWNDVVSYANRYIKFYDVMKSVDSSINIIIDGNHWDRVNNFNSIFSIVGKKCDIYGFHPAISGRAEEEVSDEISFMSVIGASHLYEKYFFDYYNEELVKWDLAQNTKLGLSEWWTNYGNMSDWILDTNWKNSSLESGLICASILSSLMKYPESIIIASRTIGLGMIRCDLDYISGKRNFFATPSFFAHSMIRNHHGKYVVKSDVLCDSYTVPFILGFWLLDNTPYIDATVTASEDTLYINLLNRYPIDWQDIEIIIDKDIIGKQAIVYELYSDSYLDANTDETPTKVIPKQKTWTVSKEYSMPPHSFTILAIPINGIIKVDESSISQKFDYTVNPNPVIDLLKITANSEIENIKIYNILGKLVFEEFAQNNQASINLDYLLKGLYIIDIKNKKTTFIKN